MQIALAPFTLRPGVTEEALLEASDAFQDRFVQHQHGVARRVLVRNAGGGYADLVFFDSAEAVDELIAAEQDDEDCARFASIMDAGEHSVCEVLRTYDRRPAGR